MNNGFESDREFREWQAAVAMQYGIQSVARSDDETSVKNRNRLKRTKMAPKRRATDKKVKA